jgi:hypothetical protein
MTRTSHLQSSRRWVFAQGSPATKRPAVNRTTRRQHPVLRAGQGRADDRNDDTYQTLASVAPTGLTERPGEVRRSTSAISYATVDDTKYSYWLQCHLDVRTSSYKHGIFGADVVYQISATNG